MNLPNTGQVTGLPEGVVVECIGAWGREIRPRDVASPAAGPPSISAGWSPPRS